MNKKEIMNRLKNQFGMSAEDYYKWLITRAAEAERLEIENAKLREEIKRLKK